MDLQIYPTTPFPTVFALFAVSCSVPEALPDKISNTRWKTALCFLEVSRSHLKEGPDNDCFVCLFFDLSYVMDRTLSQISRDFSLTNREVNVLSLLLRGYSNDQISSTLFVSIPTVKKHLASIYSKMEIKSQKQILERIHFYDK